MKAIIIASAVLVFVGAVTGFTLMYAQRQATILPDNTPEEFLSRGMDNRSRPVIVFAGDSLTHAAVSANYIELLDSRGLENYEKINGGINSQLAYSLYSRIDDIVACDPYMACLM